MGIKSHFMRLLFIVYKRRELSLFNLKTGIGFDRLITLMEGLTPIEKKIFGVKY